MGLGHSVDKRSAHRLIALVQGLLLCLLLGPTSLLARTAIVVEPHANSASHLQSALQQAAAEGEEVSVVLSATTTRLLADWQVPDPALIDTITTQLTSTDSGRNPAAGVERAFGSLSESADGQSDKLVILSDGRFDSGDAENDERFAQWLTLILAEDIRADGATVTWQPLTDDADATLINSFLEAVGAPTLADNALTQLAQVSESAAPPEATQTTEAPPVGNQDSTVAQAPTAEAPVSTAQTAAEAVIEPAIEPSSSQAEPAASAIQAEPSAPEPVQPAAEIEPAPPVGNDAAGGTDFSVATLPWWIWLVAAGAITLIAGLVLSRRKPASSIPTANKASPPPTPARPAAVNAAAAAAATVASPTPAPAPPEPPPQRKPEPEPEPLAASQPDPQPADKAAADEPGPDDTQEFFPTGAQSAVNVAASSTPLFEEKSIEEKFFGDVPEVTPEPLPRPSEEPEAAVPEQVPDSPAAAEELAAPDEKTPAPDPDATVLADTRALRAMAAESAETASSDSPDAQPQTPSPPAPAAEKPQEPAPARPQPPVDDDATVLADTRALRMAQEQKKDDEDDEAVDDDATVLAVPPPRHDK